MAAQPTLNDIDNILASLNEVKAPGASRQKIQQITSLAVNNIKSEQSIVQSLYRALKKAPATHKLGALYVIDSVVRQWIDVAQKAGQPTNIEGRGEPGTLPAAVKRVTELMPALFDDTIKALPEEQKPKLAQMVGIWARGGTFPVKTIQDFKSKMNGEAMSQPVNGAAAAAAAPAAREQTSVVQKTYGEKCMAPLPSRPLYTPVGFPPRHVYDQGFLPGRALQVNGTSAMSAPGAPTQAVSLDPRRQPQPPAAPQAHPQAPPPPATADVNSILAALSRAIPPAAPAPTFPPAPQQAPAPPQPSQAPQIAPGQIPPELAALFAAQGLPQPPPPPFAQPPQQRPQQPHYGYSAPPSAPPMQQAFQPPPHFAAIPPQPPPSIPQGYGFAPPPQQPPPQADPLASLRGILPENILNDQSKLVPALQLLQDLQNDGVSPEKWGPVLKAFEEQFQPPQPSYAAQGDHGQGGRGRSRSPDRGGRGGRGSPVYGSYDADAAKGQGNNGRGGSARNRFRQRSPQNRNSPGFGGSGRMQPKVIQHDPTLPPDNIKVLSRTLFVGGANGTQQEIQQIFERFGQVQTCIANRDKRHAFVKMTTREFALNAKAGMEELTNRNDREVMNVARQTKWGVGFGPRECCDYQRGESIIPIHKLTDADRKWLLTAEYGGTGGRALEGGMVLEEPDIEIGAGVSSKAMSKRVDPGNNQQHNNHHHGGGNKRQERNRHRHKGADRDGQAAQQGAYGAFGGGSGGGMDYGNGVHYTRPEPVAVATPPAVPGFGFSLGGQQPYR